MRVACSLLLALCCLLFAVWMCYFLMFADTCRLLCVDGVSLFVLSPLFVACHRSFVCIVLFVDCCIWCVVCLVLLALCRLLFVVCVF